MWERDAKALLHKRCCQHILPWQFCLQEQQQWKHCSIAAPEICLCLLAKINSYGELITRTSKNVARVQTMLTGEVTDTSSTTNWEGNETDELHCPLIASSISFLAYCRRDVGLDLPQAIPEESTKDMKKTEGTSFLPDRNDNAREGVLQTTGNSTLFDSRAACGENRRSLLAPSFSIAVKMHAAAFPQLDQPG